MRVALVTQSYFPVLGGVSEHVHHLALALLARGHEVTVLTGSTDRPEPEGSVELRRRGGRIVRVGRTRTVRCNGASVSLVLEPGLSSALLRIDRGAFDVLHVHSPFEPLLPIAALQYFQAPAVGTFHSAGRLAWGYGAFLPLLRKVAGRLDARIAVSRAARDHVSRWFPGEYRIVPNGVDPERFQGARALRGNRVLRLLVVGRLDPRKGHRTLFAALARLRDGFSPPPFELRVVGEGPLRSELQRYAESRGLAVSFLGAVDEQIRREEYSGADLFLAPATHGESFGVVLLEAMAAGLPILASSLRGYREVLGSSRAARFVTPGDPEAWAGALGEILSDARARETLAQRSREHVARFDWRRVVEVVEGVYSEALDSPFRPGRVIGFPSEASTIQVLPERSSFSRSPGPRDARASAIWPWTRSS